MFADFIKKIVDFQNLITIKYCWRQNLEILIIYKPSPWGHVKSHKNLYPIGLSVLTFIGNKQTNTHPDKQSI